MAIKDKFFNTLNQKHGALNKKQLAQKMLKMSADAGTAVVNILAATGIAGFKFHIPESEMVKFENDVTDHFIETNSAVHDHIVQKPIILTLTGYVGEYFYSVHKIEDMIALIVPTITLVKEFIPLVSARIQNIKSRQLATLAAKNAFGNDSKLTLREKFSTIVHEFNSLDLFTMFQSLYKLKNAQTRAFLFFEALWKSRSLFSVETTWKRYDNMVIQSIQAKRDNNADITEFSVTFKQLSFTQTLTETTEQYANRIEQMRAKTIDKGLAQGEAVSLSDLSLENPLIPTNEGIA